jgi:NAD(P)H dehydrogenase (quinone)
MKALIVYAHPEPTSFSAAMKDVAVEALTAQGYEVVVSDLYAEGFNPVAGRHDFTTVADATRFHYQQEQLKASAEHGFAADLQREQARVSGTDLFVFVYPLWWGGMPAIMKGWFDRVMACGVAYVDGRRFDSGFFLGKHGIIALTTGGTQERFSADGVYGPMAQLLYPHKRTMLEYLGLQVLPEFVAYASPRVSPQERQDYLRDWRAHLMREVSALPGAVVAGAPAR